MRKVVGGAQGKNAERATCRQSSRVGGREHFVDRPVAAARDDAVKAVVPRLGDGFGRRSRRVPRLPCDADLDKMAVQRSAWTAFRTRASPVALPCRMSRTVAKYWISL